MTRRPDVVRREAREEVARVVGALGAEGERHERIVSNLLRRLLAAHGRLVEVELEGGSAPTGSGG